MAVAEAPPRKKGEKLPEFTYNTLDGKPFSSNNLKANTKLMIVYFNPLCDLCQEETKEILSNINYFDNIQILMISPNPLEEVKRFVNLYQLQQFKQIIVLHDKQDEFYKKFNAIGYPSLYLYDENKQLITAFESQTSMEEIETAFNSANKGLATGRKRK